MEVKINREIRNYTENIFFGLSLRQFFFSICACGVAVFLHFTFSKFFNKEIVSWICILGALPFIGIGFFKYNGMPLEKFLIVCFKSQVLTPKKLKFVSESIYYEALTPYMEDKKRKEISKR